MLTPKGFVPFRTLLAGVFFLHASLLLGTEARASAVKVAVLKDSLSPDYPERAECVFRSLASEGLNATFITATALSNEGALSSQNYDCLVLPDARFFPASACANLLHFLHSGGDLVVIGGPIFDRLLYRTDGRWQTKEEILSSVHAEKVVLDMSKVQSTDWSRASANPEIESRLTIRRPGKKGQAAWAEFFIEELRGWDTYRIQLPGGAFPEGHSLVCFQASGDRNTPSMSLEIEEKDGSRWIAVVPLGRQTRSCALAVEEFKYWRDSASRGRGGRGDHLNLSNARFLVIGLARSHNVLPEGPHSFRISSIGSANLALPEEASIPVLETLHPWYKCYVTKAIDRIETVDAGFALPRGTIVLGKTEIVCPIWRSRGLGFRNPSSYRWVPILRGQDSQMRFRGTAASLMLNFDGEYANSHWLHIGLRDSRVIFQLSHTLGLFIAGAVEKMHRNVFLRSAGVERASYFEGEDVTLGCTLNSPAPAHWRARMRVWKKEAPSPTPELEKTIPLSGQSEASLNWQAPRGQSAAYQATIQLLDQHNQITDCSSHDFTILRDAPARPDEIVQVQGCDFVLKGKRWYPHGINYWPSNWGGREPREFWRHWLSPGLYDPVVAERDLAVARQLGMNSFSIQLNSPEQIPAVNDFLFRCRKFSIYVNLFLAGAHPLRPNFRLVTTFLKEGKFTGNPAIYAYDIAWEPHLGPEAERKRLDPDWARWIDESYGSIENAESDWKFDLRKENGGITTPTQNQILNPGPWNIMVAAYRQFLDDFISRGYREMTRKIREIDPTHLVAARSGYGGTGEMGIDPQMPFDLISGARHLDFISPEGYGLSPNWETARAAGFTTLYARYAGNGKPVFWAEFGQSVHPAYDEAALARQRNIYENMYRLVLDSFAQGSAGWWFPGGYRFGEDSDYGIISPDLTPRPSAEVLANYSPLTTAPRPVPSPNAWITIDRDLHPRGYSQIRRRHEEEYIKARSQGKVVALRTVATGTTSATVPDVAVGNVPYTGGNPHKYLKAEFNWVRLVLRGGKNIEVEKGGTVTVRKGQAIRVDASVANTGEPTWLAARGGRLSKGDVYLSCSINGRTVKRFPIRNNVGRYCDYESLGMLISPALLAPVHVSLRLEAFGKASFGEKFEFSLGPQ